MKKKLSRDEWLEKALLVFSREGFGRLHIDRLVKAMGVTKGSFYWHFSNRKDFIVQLIGHWEKKLTDSVVMHVSEVEGSSQERLLALMLFITQNQLAQYDFPIHALAQNEPDIFSLVRDVMKKRFSYVASLFSEMGFTGVELDLRSRATVMLMIQEQNSLLKESIEKQMERIHKAHALFISH